MAIKIKDAKRAIETAIVKAIDKKTLEILGELAVAEIQNRTFRGRGVTQNRGNTQKLDALKESTVKKRKNLKKKGQLSAFTSVRRSNLTQSGDMLLSLESKVAGDEVIIAPKGNENVAKVEYNANTGREFLYLAKNEITKLSKYLKVKLIEVLNNQLR